MSTRSSVCSQASGTLSLARCDELNVKSTLALVMSRRLGSSVQITMGWVHTQSSVLERWYLLSPMRITLMWRI